MERRCKLPCPNEFSAIYHFKNGDSVTVIAPAISDDSTWLIDDEGKEIKVLRKHGINPVFVGD